MKKLSILLFLLTFALGAIIAHGVVINPGQSIQSAINASSAGDVIYVNEGFYPENLVIDNKAIEIRGQGASKPRVYNLTLKNVPTTVRISNLSVTETDTQILSVENVGIAVLDGIKTKAGDLKVDSSNVRISQSDLARDLDANRSVVLLKDSNVTNDLNAHQSDLRLLRSRVTKDVNMHDSQNHLGTATQCVVLQSTIGEKLTTKAAQSFVCYNTIRYAYFEGKVEITGNTFDGRGLALVGIDLNGSSTSASIHNNLIIGMGETHGGTLTEKIIGIRIDGGSKAEITNNVIWSLRDIKVQGTNVNCGIGIFVKVDTGTTIKGNIIYRCADSTSNKTGGNRLVHAPASVNLSYNCLYDGIPVAGGVTNVSGINTNPDVTSSASRDFTLRSSSPCINKGPEDARYNDRDGTRNDIGMFGGHNFIPNGKTTDKPIVIGLDVAPVFVPTNGNITIESTGATVK